MARPSGVRLNGEGCYEYMSDYVPACARTYFYRAEAVIEADGRGYVCEKCGSKHNIQIHHIDRDITNNRANNLMVLCYQCHKNEHPERLNFRKKHVRNPKE